MEPFTVRILFTFSTYCGEVHGHQTNPSLNPIPVRLLCDVDVLQNGFNTSVFLKKKVIPQRLDLVHRYPKAMLWHTDGGWMAPDRYVTLTLTLILTLINLTLT